MQTESQHEIQNLLDRAQPFPDYVPKVREYKNLVCRSIECARGTPCSSGACSRWKNPRLAKPSDDSKDGDCSIFCFNPQCSACAGGDKPVFHWKLIRQDESPCQDAACIAGKPCLTSDCTRWKYMRV